MRRPVRAQNVHTWVQVPPPASVPCMGGLIGRLFISLPQPNIVKYNRIICKFSFLYIVVEER